MQRTYCISRILYSTTIQITGTGSSYKIQFYEWKFYKSSYVKIIMSNLNLTEWISTNVNLW